MGKVIAFLVLVGACLVVSIILIYQIADTQTKQTYAQAALVAAQGQARLDSAQASAVQTAASSQALLTASQAFAITMTAALPWFILGLLGLGVLGVAVMGIIVMVMLSKRPENKVVYLPPPQMPRIEVWRALEDMRNQGFEVEIRRNALVER